MKKLVLILFLVTACSDDAATSTQNNTHDVGTDVTYDGAQSDSDTTTGTTDSGNDNGTNNGTTQDDDAGNTSSDVNEEPPDLSPLGGDRPVTPVLPTEYAANVAHPLVIVLHGYSADSTFQNAYFKITSVQDEFDFVLLSPDGLKNSYTMQYWNATDYCCDLEGSGVDDVGYISGIIEEAKHRFNIDPKRVFLIGHSNGGFMSYRMACDRADLIAGIVSLAGAMPYDDSVCEPSEPVAVAQVHGTADTTISYYGLFPTLVTPGYPSARTSVEFWRDFNGCDEDPLDRDAIDISSGVGTETDVEYYPNCQGGAGELWTINFGPHIPNLNADFPRKSLEFLLAHPKP